MKTIISAIIVLLLLSITGCGGDDTVTPDDIPDETKVVLRDSTVVLEPEDAEDFLREYTESGEMTLDKDYAESEAIEVGSVLVGGVSENAPYGFLRKVTGVQRDGDIVHLTTEQADLTDAIQSCDIRDSLFISQEDVDSVSVIEGIQLLPAGYKLLGVPKGEIATEFAFGVDLIVYDTDGNIETKDDQVRVEGELGVSIGLELEIDIDFEENWNKPELTEVMLACRRSTDSSVQLTWGAKATLLEPYKKKIATIHAGTYTIPAGIPIVVVADVDIFIKISLTGEISIDFGLSMQETSRFGWRYRNGTWEDFNESEKTVEPLNISFNGAIRAYAGIPARLNFSLYGIAGPYIEGEVYALAEGSVEAGTEVFEINAEVSSGLKAGAGFILKVFSKTLIDFEVIDWYIFRLVIWEHTWPLEAHGNINIVTSPDEINAPWTLSGPYNYYRTDYGDRALNNMADGEYIVDWGDVTGWITPVDETKTLETDAAITFSGTYLEEYNPGGDFVPIPAGTFLMGSPIDELERYSGETQHTVTLTTPFYMFTTEVTNQQYAEMAQWAYNRGYCSSTGASLYDALDGSTQELLDLDGSFCEITFSGTAFTVYTGKEEHPVKEVTWYGAVAYCDWLSLRDGLPRAYNHSTWQCNDPYNAQGYRLPTEAEWEYACRAGTQTPFNTGNCLDAGTEANYNGNYPYTGCPSGAFVRWTVPVGSYPANGYGLYDMHGNLWEWCNDWYGYYSGNVTDPEGPVTGSYRVLRGGDWNDDAQYCRSAYRGISYPSISASDYGFRPVRSAI